MNNYSRPVRLAVCVWVALLLLLATTVGCSFIPLGFGNALVNGIVAVAKAGLIVAFFMHLRTAATVIRLVAIFGAVTLSLLFILSGLDFATRATTPAPWQVTPPSLYVEPAY